MRLLSKSQSSFAIAFGLVLAASPSSADIQANRARWIGPEVARAASYTAHVPGAEKRGSEYICPAQFRGGQKAMTEAQMQAIHAKRSDWYRERNDPLMAEYDKEINDNLRRGSEIPRMINRNELPREEGQRRMRDLDKDREAIGARLREKQAVLNAEAEKLFPIPKQLEGLEVYLQHSPSDPNATIIPFQGENPAPAFDAELDRALKSFLASCGPVGYVFVRHYFRDAQRPPVDDKSADLPVLSYSYTYQGGTLTLQPTPGSTMGGPFSVTKGQDITLAGFRALYERVAQIRADYRKDFAYANRRKPGIVYKYDAFWQQFPDFEIARRIFDGDFTPYTNTIDFTFLYTNYGSLFTKNCRAQVESVTTIHYQTREYVGGETNLPDLTFEPKYETGTASFEVDSRFAPKLPEFTRDQAMHMMRVWTEKIKRGERFKWSVQGMRDAVGDYAQQIQLPQNQMFFEKNTCTSATMQQLGANIYRAASGLPSLQAEGERIAGAEQESDPPMGKEPPTGTTTPSAAPSNADSPPPVQTRPAQQPAGSKPEQASEQTRPVAKPPETNAAVPATAPPTANPPTPSSPDPVTDAKKRTQDPASAPAAGTLEQSRRPARTEPPAQTGTAAPAIAPSSGAPAAPAGKDPVAEAKARAAAMQEVSEAHVRGMNEVSKEFQEKMRNAKTAQERKALQDEFRRVQQERLQEFQNKMREFSRR